ncbi:helix-turn-helix transcriptional regulator [Paracoccus sp. Ld10]|uniref:helix-turn-helix domain-containing protein n=1 Tax=Paracoccus sp. Ld10 TaxID=649158 RepID=UPI0038690BAB
MKNPHADTPAAIFLRRQIELISHRKTQKEIAHQAGFVNANMISLLKNGASKIPLDRVPDLARAIEVDPAYLMRIALEQSIGTMASVAILEVFGTPTTVNERAWLDEIREASGDTDPRLTAQSRTALRAVFGR